MKQIEKELESLSGYLISIKRNTIKGWYELEIGIPIDWIYKSNDYVKCEVKEKTNVGNILIISPKKDDIVIDDLIDFVKLIIETNSKIREREKEFTNKINKVKEDLENQAKEFYKELNELKEKSFNNFDIDENNTSNTNIREKKTTTKKTNSKKKVGRPPKSKNSDVTTKENELNKEKNHSNKEKDDYGQKEDNK